MSNDEYLMSNECLISEIRMCTAWVLRVWALRFRHSSLDIRHFLPASLRLCGLVLLVLCAAPSAAEQLMIVPADFTLDGPAAKQQIVVERVAGDGDLVGQVTDKLTL